MKLIPALVSIALVLGAASPASAAPPIEADGEPATAPDDAPPPTRASIARQFALSYLDFWSRPNAATLFATPVFYAPRVQFHGRTMRAEELFAEKVRFVRRWPLREYRPRLGTMETSCRGAVCVVHTRFDFVAADDARHRRSAGRAELELAIRFVAGRPYIFRETSRVTHRDGARSAQFGPGPP